MSEKCPLGCRADECRQSEPCHLSAETQQRQDAVVIWELRKKYPEVFAPVSTARSNVDHLLDRTVTIRDLCRFAASLQSEDGENPEYDRALAELITDAACLSMDQDLAAVKKLIRALQVLPTRRQHAAGVSTNRAVNDIAAQVFAANP